MTLLLLLLGSTMALASPTTTRPPHEDLTTTEPPMVNYVNFDLDHVSLNRNSSDNDDSIIHAEDPNDKKEEKEEDRIVNGQYASNGDYPIKARLLAYFQTGAFKLVIIIVP